MNEDAQASCTDGGPKGFVEEWSLPRRWRKPQCLAVAVVVTLPYIVPC